MPQRANAVPYTYTGSNPYTDALIADGYKWSTPGSETTTITYFFKDGGASGNPGGAWYNWEPIEEIAYRLALDEWAAVANLDFVEVGQEAHANFVERVGNASALQADADDDLLGWHVYPWPNQVEGAFNRNGGGWDEGSFAGGLNPGGDGFYTLLHEIGHGLGLDHTFDGAETFPGTVKITYGLNGLDQGVFSVMSYAQGWPSNRSSGTSAYGLNTGLGAFDIAAIQTLYGARESHQNGDTYWLPSENGTGTGFRCIWDTGGTDTFAYAGSANATIDLRAATLDNSPTGGGAVSAADGIFGGYTIANGVVIENALGGTGNDIISGNAARNRLEGNIGADTISGGANDDILIGGLGADTLHGDSGNDVFRFAGRFASGGSSAVRRSDVAAGEIIDGGTDTDTIVVHDSVDFSATTIQSIERLTFDGTGAATFGGMQFGNGGVSGALAVEGSNGPDTITVNLSSGGPAVYLANLGFTRWNDEDRVIVNGSAVGDLIVGTDMADEIHGLGGADRIISGEGADEVRAGAGNDRLEYSAATLSFGEIIDGEAGGDTLAVFGEVNFIQAEWNPVPGPTGPLMLPTFAPVTIRSIEKLEFATNYVDPVNSANFAASHFGAGNLVQALAVSGTAQTDKLSVAMGDATSLNLGRLSFTNWSSSDTVTIVGDSDGEVIIGTRVADTIRSGGGADILTGGLGADVFVFESSLGVAHVDTIRDFSVRDDTIHLDNAVMTGLGTTTGTLSAAAFVMGAAAADAADRVIYNSGTGDLFYDADGTGSSAAIKIATLSAGLAMTHEDFVII